MIKRNHKPKRFKLLNLQTAAGVEVKVKRSRMPQRFKMLNLQTAVDTEVMIKRTCMPQRFNSFTTYLLPGEFSPLTWPAHS